MENISESQPPDEKIKFLWEELVKMEERQNALSGLIDAATPKVTSIESHFNDFFSKSDPSIKSKAETIIENYSNSEQFLKSAQEIKKEIEEFKEFINGNETVEKPGFKKDLEALFNTNKKVNEDLQVRWETSYQTLFTKIDGLISGATTLGLATSYQEQKKSYKTPVILWSIVFNGAVIFMMMIGIQFYKTNGATVKDLADAFKLILARLPFFIPAIWLAYFASRQQSKYQRLQQEYIYKETLAKSYESYKKEIMLLQDGEHKAELQQKLMASLVEMCGENPSRTLEHKSHNERFSFIKPLWSKSKKADGSVEA